MISGAIPAKFRGIPRNFAEFRRNCAEITSEVKKFRGIPCWRNSVDTLLETQHQIPTQTAGNTRQIIRHSGQHTRLDELTTSTIPTNPHSLDTYKVLHLPGMSSKTRKTSFLTLIRTVWTNSKAYKSNIAPDCTC